MTTVLDRGCEREQEMRDDALREQERRAGLTGKTVADSATHCAVCTDPIPDDRRAAYHGVQTCAACQTELERATSPAKR